MPYYLGLDLGQSADYSALAVLEEPIFCPPLGGWVSGAQLDPVLRLQYEQGMWYHWQQQAPGKPPLWLRSLSRYLLRTPYTTVVDDVIRRLGGKDEQRRDAVLVVDGTGVGAAVVDLFRFAELPCEMFSVIITGGVKAERNHIPKRDLISAVQVAIQTQRLQPIGHTKEIETFFSEMANYQLKLTSTGHDTYNARTDSIHDDLVLAVALACWYRGSRNRGE